MKKILTKINIYILSITLFKLIACSPNNCNNNDNDKDNKQNNNNFSTSEENLSYLFGIEEDQIMISTSTVLCKNNNNSQEFPINLDFITKKNKNNLKPNDSIENTKIRNLDEKRENILNESQETTIKIRSPKGNINNLSINFNSNNKNPISLNISINNKISNDENIHRQPFQNSIVQKISEELIASDNWSTLNGELLIPLKKHKMINSSNLHYFTEEQISDIFDKNLPIICHLMPNNFTKKSGVYIRLIQDIFALSKLYKLDSQKNKKFIKQISRYLNRCNLLKDDLFLQLCKFIDHNSETKYILLISKLRDIKKYKLINVHFLEKIEGLEIPGDINIRDLNSLFSSISIFDHDLKFRLHDYYFKLKLIKNHTDPNKIKFEILEKLKDLNNYLHIIPYFHRDKFEIRYLIILLHPKTKVIDFILNVYKGKYYYKFKNKEQGISDIGYEIEKEDQTLILIIKQILNKLKFRNHETQSMQYNSNTSLRSNLNNILTVFESLYKTKYENEISKHKFYKYKMNQFDPKQINLVQFLKNILNNNKNLNCEDDDEKLLLTIVNNMSNYIKNCEKIIEGEIKAKYPYFTHIYYVKNSWKYKENHKYKIARFSSLYMIASQAKLSNDRRFLIHKLFRKHHNEINTNPEQNCPIPHKIQASRLNLPNHRIEEKSNESYDQYKIVNNNLESNESEIYKLLLNTKYDKLSTQYIDKKFKEKKNHKYEYKTLDYRNIKNFLKNIKQIFSNLPDILLNSKYKKKYNIGRLLETICSMGNYKKTKTAPILMGKKYKYKEKYFYLILLETNPTSNYINYKLHNILIEGINDIDKFWKDLSPTNLYLPYLTPIFNKNFDFKFMDSYRLPKKNKNIQKIKYQTLVDLKNNENIIKIFPYFNIDYKEGFKISSDPDGIDFLMIYKNSANKKYIAHLHTNTKNDINYIKHSWRLNNKNINKLVSFTLSYLAFTGSHIDSNGDLFIKMRTIEKYDSLGHNQILKYNNNNSKICINSNLKNTLFNISNDTNINNLNQSNYAIIAKILCLIYKCENEIYIEIPNDTEIHLKKFKYLENIFYLCYNKRLNCIKCSNKNNLTTHGYSKKFLNHIFKETPLNFSNLKNDIIKDNILIKETITFVNNLLSIKITNDSLDIFMSWFAKLPTSKIEDDFQEYYDKYSKTI